MSEVKPEGEFMYGTEPDAESGETVMQFKTNRVPAEVLAAQRANRHLKTRGGQGSAKVALIGDAVLTVQETVAVAIAKDMADDACRRHNKHLDELTLLELNEGLAMRVKGRGTSEAQVGAELARLQNVAIYGDSVRRR